MNVAFLSHTAKTGVFRVGSHHLAREFARKGHRVAHISSPITLGHLLRFREVDVRRRAKLCVRPQLDEAGVLHVVAPALMPLTVPRFRREMASIVAAAISTLLRRGGVWPVHILLVDQPAFVPVIESLRAEIVVYRPTDMHPDEPLRSAERAMVGAAQMVVATSEVVLESLSLNDGMPKLVLENGVEYERFASAFQPGVGAAYVGALDRRFDWDAVRVMADAFPGVPVKLAGPVVGPTPALPSNVQLLGPVPYEQLPRLLAESKVGLLPLSNDPGNQSRSPMKYYEYLSAGLHVVARRTRSVGSRGAPGVHLYDDHADAQLAFREAISTVERNHAGQVAARAFDWSARAEELLSFVSRGFGSTYPAPM